MRSYFVGKMKSATRLTSKGQVVIPKAVRDRLRWHAGTRLVVEASDKDAVVLRAEGRSPTNFDQLIDDVCGFLTEGDPLAELEREHRAEIEKDERGRRRRS